MTQDTHHDHSHTSHVHANADKDKQSSTTDKPYTDCLRDEGKSRPEKKACVRKRGLLFLQRRLHE